MPILTEHFDASEFLCPCGSCTGGKMSPTFMAKLEKFRGIYGKPVKIVPGGGFRCVAYEKKNGRSGNGMHPQGRAADFEVLSDADRYQALRIAFAIFGGIGINNGSIHVDDRDAAAARSWTYYKKT